MRNTLDVRVEQSAKPIPSWVFGSMVIEVFVTVMGLVMFTRNWNNGISGDEYFYRFQELETRVYEHVGE